MRYFNIIPWILLLASVIPHQGLSQSILQCNCKNYPYDPTIPCYDYCTKNLLDSAQSSELIMILGLSDTLSKKIALIKEEYPLKSLSDYFARLSPEETQELKKTLNAANKWQRFYFNIPIVERNKFAIDMQQFILKKQEFEKTHG